MGSDPGSPEKARAFDRLPPYALGDVPGILEELRAGGVDVVDLGAGDSNLPPPTPVVEALADAARDPACSGYPFQSGLDELRVALAEWMQTRFGVSLDPYRGLLPLIGSKEGLAKLPLAFIDPGDVAIVPDPGYLVYRGGVLLAGGEPYAVALRPDNDFLVPLDRLPPDVLSRAKLLYLNYPNNPTAAVASRAYLERAVALCREHGILLVQDAAYSEFGFGHPPPSVLEIDGADEVALEFHSFSKTYNMTGWRLGWVAGGERFIAALQRVKTFMDTGVFLAVQAAGVAALKCHGDWVPRNMARFRSRRDAAVQALAGAGFRVRTPEATMYLWVPVPESESSMDFARRALEDEAVVVMPGAALGAGGEGFFRIALTQPEDRLREGVERLGRLVR